ncbi:MAG: glycogen debranching protein GlgX [Ramlibacter sp.]|nr:glycogen debranching protein GlgX [Ramlibacter sp.]
MSSNPTVLAVATGGGEGSHASSRHCDSGRPWPLGATLRDGGVNFAIFSSIAEKVELCLFDAAGDAEVARIALPRRSDNIWHGFVPGLAAGARYGIRVHGPYDPDSGPRCNPAKLLIDPYARALDRPLRGAAWQYAYGLESGKRDLKPNAEDNAQHAARCVVVDPAFDWGDDRPPATALARSVFYEVHVKGFTQQLEAVPEQLRGTFAGMASDAAIAHLKRIGVTAVELLPVQAFNDERRLVDLGLGNYWGYNTIGFFAPDARYCAQQGIDEFKQMVKALHAAGIEVILDVVYNHTAEGNHLGPTLCFKGIDNGAYYRLTEDRRHYIDYTGTGNTLDTSHPATLRLVLDSLRYWVEEMHVDGFRFDLAPAIARDAAGAFDHRAPFLSAVAQDPVLCRVKLIAEPWDIGENGYQVGGFPVGWAEWNGRYRDTVRDFWRSSEGVLRDFAARLCGSADIYAPSGRPPSASVNCVTVHDGFTLNDLVSYDEKSNDANAEENRDGESHNRSWNCGAEGATSDAEVLALRERQKRNFLATLLVSRGVPLLLAGDELGRTQGGNNNAYCQDNPVSWIDWERARDHEALTGFVQALVGLRNALPVLRQDSWLSGVENEHGVRDIGWFSVWGQDMTQDEWDDPAVRCIAALLDGRCCSEPGPSVLLAFNASTDDATFTLPPQAEGCQPWQLRVDTARGHFSADAGEAVDAGGQLTLQSHSMAVLVQPVV